MRTRIGIAALALAGCAAAATPGFALQGGADTSRVPLVSSDDRARVALVDGYLADKQWSAAVDVLQLLLEEHRDAVLPEEFGRGDPTQFTVYPGVNAWVLDTLADAPSRLRDAYREQFGASARLALDGARATGSVARLVEVARRWPITDAAIEAWILAGDLELERGDVDAALHAWERARARSATCGLPPREDLARRLALAQPDAEPRLFAPERRDGRGGLVLPGAGEGGGPIPLRSADIWEVTDLDLDPLGDTGGRERYNLFPVLADDKLIVSTTLKVYAFDPYTARLLWETEEPPGWERLGHRSRRELFAGIDRELSVVTPAVGGGVVVCALQVARESRAQDYQSIDIVTSMPERRLFAFDLETGRELWNHAPPPLWDGEGGPFEERMIVSSAPLVVGTRVLVASHRMAGRIDFHAACYDLFTGKLLWSTGLASGQVDLNMFGRQIEEFCGAPLAVEGDRVLVQTQLGTVACLDLFSGHIHWQTRYENVPLEKNFGWGSAQRSLQWRNAPPAVAGGVVVSTPSDSYAVLGFDLETGAALWSFDYNRLPADRGGENEDPVYDTLLGAEGDTIFLGGNYVSALQRPGGLSARPGRSASGWFEPRWSVFVGRSDRLPRPVLGRDEVLIPTYDERLVVDRTTGQRLGQKTLEWRDRERGNLLLGRGVLYTLGNERIAAAFDWGVLIERTEAELAGSPGDVELTRELAELLRRRAEGMAQDGEAPAALALLTRARSLLEPLLGASGDATSPAVAGDLHAVLRDMAGVQRLQANGPRALDLLAQALELAPDGAALRDTLLEQEEILRLRDPEAWRATLARLEQDCPELPLPDERLRGSTAWLVGESLLADLDPEGQGIPVGLWVLFTRAEASARAGDRRAALEDLHLALERFGTWRVSGATTAGDVARARIERRIELDGPAAYAPFEERAVALLEQARAARDAHLLGEVPRLYPQARAAEDAARLRLAWALEDGEAELACALAFPALGDGPQLDTQDVSVLLRVAELLHASGNDAFEAAVIRRIAAETRGAFDADHPRHAGRTFAEVAAELAETEGPGAATPASFEASIARTAEHRGRYERLGTLPGTSTLLFRHLRTLVAFGPDAPGTPRWEHALSFPVLATRVHLAPGRVVVGGGENLVALDAESGVPVWEWSSPGEDVLYVDGDAGLVLVLVAATDPRTHRSIERLQALDRASGTPLWSVPLGEQAGWYLPLCGEGRAALLRERWGPNTSEALVVDLLRGRIERVIDLGDSVLKDSWKATWIEDGRLVVPFFSASREGKSRVAAYGLGTGALDWEIPVSSGAEISSVLGAAGTSYLVVLPVSHQGGGDAGYVARLDLARGQAQRIVSLKHGDDPMIGAEPGTRVELSSPYLFVHSRREGSQRTPVTMIDLEGRGAVWTYNLPVGHDDLYGTPLPEPALSDSLVAIAYTTIDKARLLRDEARLELVDREAGLRRDSRVLSPQLCKAEDLGLYGLGPALILVGTGRYAGKEISRIEVLETVR